MLPVDLFDLFVQRFEDLEIPYMITGSVAGMIYGEPRMTHDIDIVVAIRAGDLNRLAVAFPMQDYYFPDPQALMLEIRRKIRGNFNIIHGSSGFKADVYVAGDDPLHTWGLNNRRAFDLAGRRLQLAPPEYVIIRKLSWYREGGGDKHVNDVRAILQQGTPINHEKVMDSLSPENTSLYQKLRADGN